VKNLFKDRRVIIYLVSVLIPFVIIAALGLKILSSQTKELHHLREKHKEMSSLRQEFLSLQQKIQTVENKKHLANVIEHAPMILTVRKVTVKQSFENPELLNITLMLSFLKTK